MIKYEASVAVALTPSFCFRTSDGKLAWATVVGVIPNVETAVLKVRVWG